MTWLKDKNLNLNKRVDAMKEYTLEELIKKCHENSVAAGWWHDLETGEAKERSLKELFCLCISELIEAMEGVRKDLMDDHLPDRKMEDVELADFAIRMFDIAGGYNVDVGGYSRHSIDRLIYASVRESYDSHIKSEMLFDIIECTTECYSPRANIVGNESVDNHYFIIALELLFEYCHIHEIDLSSALLEKIDYNKTRQDHKLTNRAKAGGKKF